MSEQPKATVKSWELPVVERSAEELAAQTTDIFNRRRDWKYEPPEPELEISPPTAEEIEAIRASAQADGFAQGQQEGLSEGLAQGKQQGQEQGFAEGFEQGMAQGLAAAQHQIDEQMAALQSLMSQLHQPLAQMEKSLEKELIQLSVSLARAVVRSEVKTNQDLIFQALSEGLKVLPVQEKSYQIHLNPEDLALLTSHFSEQEIERHHWNLIESPQLSRGGCEIITESNAVDISIEKRVKDVLDRFLLEQGFSQIQPDEED